VAKLYDGDIGTVLKVTTGADFTTLTDATCQLIVKRPNDTTVTWDATIASVTAEKQAGVVRYIFDGTNDLVGAGTYTLQALVWEGTGSDNKWYGQTVGFSVAERWS
jgi:hypothetical protein